VSIRIYISGIAYMCMMSNAGLSGIFCDIGVFEYFVLKISGFNRKCLL